MRKLIAGIALAFCMFVSVPSVTHAYTHGYQRRTDEIYAIARHEVAVYADNDGDDFQKYLKEYTGFCVTERDGSWMKIEYQSKGDTKTGWITKSDFYSDCLIYDGSEKQPMADGVYKVTEKNSSYIPNTDSIDSTTEAVSKTNVTYQFKMKFISDDCYYIQRTDTEQYLLADQLFSGDDSELIWGSEEAAGSFRLTRKDSYYVIQDSVTNRYFETTDSGLPGFSNNASVRYRFVRTSRANTKDVMRDFTQFDPDWGATYYGPGKNDDPSTNLYCTSGCGILANVNAVYALTGQFMSPTDLGDYAVKKGYRILDNGTDNGIFRAGASKFGKKYGYTYDGSGGTFEQLRKKLAKGDTAVAHVQGHYVSIIDYNKKTKKYLLMDSHYLPKRATCSYGDWVSQQDLSSGALMVQEFYYFKATD